jgi:endonuclease G
MLKNSLKILLAVITAPFKYPKTFFCFVLLLGGWLAYQRFWGKTELTFKGQPQPQSKLSSVTWTKTLINQDFIIGYSESRCNPLWVAYRLTAVPKNAPDLPRPSHFTIDKRTTCQVAHKNYDRSGYDRGHLAPNHAISALYGKQAQLDTFKLSNIAPQRPNLNRKWWQRLEAVELKHFTQAYPTVWVVTGTVFDSEPARLPMASQVAIPSRFYKIYAGLDALAQPHLLAFLVPQEVNGNEPLDRFMVSVDAVEKATGLDFFHQLDDKTETKIEAALDSDSWKLPEVNNTPSRY